MQKAITIIMLNKKSFRSKIINYVNVFFSIRKLLRKTIFKNEFRKKNFWKFFFNAARKEGSKKYLNRSSVYERQDLTELKIFAAPAKFDLALVSRDCWHESHAYVDGGACSRNGIK